MQQSGKIRLGGGNVGSLTPETILYGKATYITDIDYSNITLNKLVFKEPLTFSKCNITGTLNSSNEISIDRKLIYSFNLSGIRMSRFPLLSIALTKPAFLRMLAFDMLKPVLRPGTVVPLRKLQNGATHFLTV